MRTKRAWRDADPFFRCEARVTLSDKSHAQCGRHYNNTYQRNPYSPVALCTQHGDMVFSGKPVFKFSNGRELKPIDRQSTSAVHS